MNPTERKNDIRRAETLNRLAAIGAEHRKLTGQLEAIENTRDAEIMAARKLGITMQQIADLVGLTKGRVSQIEKGIR